MQSICSIVYKDTPVICRYLLQVFLRLEVNHLCAECLTDHEITELANEVCFHVVIMVCCSENITLKC